MTQDHPDEQLLHVAAFGNKQNIPPTLLFPLCHIALVGHAFLIGIFTEIIVDTQAVVRNNAEGYSV